MQRFSVEDDGTSKEVLCFRAAVDIAVGSELQVDSLGAEHVVGITSHDLRARACVLHRAQHLHSINMLTPRCIAMFVPLPSLYFSTAVFAYLTDRCNICTMCLCLIIGHKLV